ncbi:FG-GAP-like repeat-containing protein [Flavobacterium sp. DGU11]|uniref:FG-GAP-like repeat-containing protein n=1 Tax=Flavobacterium arundinis TaxID=3139143 RepID=A0ABU9I1J0_9FLAO
MKQIFTLAFLCLSPLALLAQQDCAHPQVVGPGTYNASLTAGSEVPNPICTQGQTGNLTKGAWFSYTPTEIHTTTVSTAISLTVDTRVHIYKGSCGALVCVAGDDDSGPGYTSVASFTAETGVTYYIVFDNNWEGSAEYSDNFPFTLTEAVYVAPMFEPQFIDIGGSRNCVVDMNGDYLDDVIGVDNGVVHVLFQNANGSGFTSQDLPALSSQNTPSWSIAAGDYNKDGFNDLLYGSGGGSTVMISNSTGTAFTSKLETPASFLTQRTNFVDIDNDGNLDAFMCDDNAANVYFQNTGDGGGNFKRSGLNGAPDLGIYPTGGNYASIWVDYDNDGDLDLYIAKCRGANNDAAKDELHRNNGNGTFTNVAEELGFADYHQSWSSAWGDFNNDGFIDVLVGSNAGLDGSLFTQKLMKNNGNGTFTNVTVGSGLDTFSGTSRDYFAHDFNNDGFIDILGGGNYILFNNGDMTFNVVGGSPEPGPVGDLNNDGFLDIQNGNTIHMGNDNGNNWIKIHLKGIQSNSNGIGARVEVYTDAEHKYIREIRSGDGFEYMGSLNAHFGLGENESIDHVAVRWPSGTVDIVENPDINHSLLVTEGQTLGTGNVNSTMFTVYPNPAKDVINISSNSLSVTKAHIYDLSGRLVKTADVTNGVVPVQQLNKGTYILIIQDNTGKQHTSKFIKG